MNYMEVAVINRFVKHLMKSEEQVREELTVIVNRSEIKKLKQAVMTLEGMREAFKIRVGFTNKELNEWKKEDYLAYFIQSINRYSYYNGWTFTNGGKSLKDFLKASENIGSPLKMVIFWGEVQEHQLKICFRKDTKEYVYNFSREELIEILQETLDKVCETYEDWFIQVKALL